MCVSVPYWGSLYFNRIEKNFCFGMGMFPSPIGVLYISMYAYDYDKDGSYSFRPLLGFFIFQSKRK